MKLMVISFLIIFITFLQFSSAISITEAELNPAGDDAGNEWAELYSSSEFNLSGTYLQNHDGGIYNLSISFSGYYLVIFPKQFLDNSNESVFLKNGSVILAQTSILKDDKNNDLTWQLCSGEWIFKNSTKGGANSCDSSSNYSENSSNSSSSQDTSTSNNSSSNSSASNQNTNITKASSSQESPRQPQQAQSEDNGKIILNSKTEETSFRSKDEKIRLAMIYAFAFLCVIIIILLSLRKL